MQAKEKREKADVARAVIGVIGAASVISLALVAPNAVQLLAAFDPKRRSYNRRFYVESAIGRLKRKGFIKFEKNNKGTSVVRLTEKGKQEFIRYQIGEHNIKKPKKWDGKYRVVIFDVREYRRGMRNFLRNTLRNFGFVRLQNSVWVYPYECEELIKLLKAYCRIGKDVLYLEVSSIENDGWLKKEFGL